MISPKYIISRLASKKMKIFKRRHNNEECYIFGDGPSVKLFDIKEFSDLPSICCNMFPFHKDFSRLDVRYCTFLEPYAFAPKIFQPKCLNMEGMEEILKEYRAIMKKFPTKTFFVSASNLFSILGENIYFMFRQYPDTQSEVDYKLRHIECVKNSFYACLTLAKYLGFKKIYLVGFDGWVNYPSRSGHWYELGEGSVFDSTNLPADYLNILQREIEIVAITPDGNSRNVGSISYESYTGKKLEYKENHQLLSERHLKLLSTYPEYKIYA